MNARDQLRRDDASMNVSTAANQVLIAIEKIARSQAWDIEGAVPFPEDTLPLLQEASKLLARAHARLRAHAQQHVWPVRDRLRTEARLTEAFAAMPVRNEEDPQPCE